MMIKRAKSVKKTIFTEAVGKGFYYTRGWNWDYPVKSHP